MTEKWAFTIKYNPNNLTEDEYKQKIQELLSHWKKQKINILEQRDENQTKKGEPTKYHMHGTIEIKRGVYRKKLMLPNYHIKLVAWTDAGWTDYINKNVKCKMVINKQIPTRTCSPPLPEVSYNLFKRNQN